MLPDCPWTDTLEGCECSDLPEDVEPSLVENALAVASAMLARLSGYSVGLCPDVLRPLTMCGRCRSFCCGGADSIRLTGANGLPVWEVEEVRLGATPYADSDWRFDRVTSRLYLKDGKWPLRDDVASDCGEGEAFCVDVLVGSPPDAWALSTVRSLACELLKSCLGRKCRLPRNMTSVTSGGITVSFLESDLRYWIPEVASWVHGVNPHRTVLPPALSSPDLDFSHSWGGGCCAG